MDTNNRPRGHERKVAGTGSVEKKGSGLGLGGPVGGKKPGAGLGEGRPLNRPNLKPSINLGGGSGGGDDSGGSMRRGGGMGCGPIAIVAVLILFFLLRSCGSILLSGDSGSSSGGLSVNTGSDSSGGSVSGSTSSGTGSGSGTAASQTGAAGGLGSLLGFPGFEDYYASGSASGTPAGSSYGGSGSGSGMDLESLLQSLYGSTAGESSSSGSAAQASGSSEETDTIEVNDNYAHSDAYSDAFNNNHTVASGSTDNGNGELNTSVSKKARAKYTKLKGNGKDKATILVYMCGTDLESKYGMGTSDIKEMASAALNDNVRILVLTGGCRKWQNNFTSNTVNQIYEVKSGGLDRLENDFGKKAMTDPATLTEFIGYGVKKYPADRYGLIFWDHGSGTTGGYGYDEKYANAGSMSLAGIDQAVEDAGVKFDFIGFDACLMATLENALMLSNNADYMIASEETEPGTGWYYKNWLTALSKNTSMPTIEFGRMIADDFMLASQQARQGDKVTLSVTDLAELSAKVPQALSAFSSATAELIRNDDYKQVSDARRNALEFAGSNRLDQVDVVDFALGVGGKEADALAKAIKAAVKYNRTSRSYGDAHGLSIYFPYKRASYIDRIVKVYKSIGMDSEYTKCIKEFANVAVSGQAAGGGYTSPFSSLFGGSSTSDDYADLFGQLFGSSSSGGYSSSGSGSYSSGSGSYSGSGISDYANLFGGLSGSGSGSSGYSSSGSDQLMEALIGSLFSDGSAGYGRVRGLDEDNTDFLEEELVRSSADYIYRHHINTDHLVWTENSSGQTVLGLDEADWNLVQDADLSVLYDDGEGFINLGLDNILNYDDNGALLGSYDHTWFALNGHPAAFFHTDTVENGDEYAVHGYVPALVNGELCDILITFDDVNPYGFVSGIRFRYDAQTTDTVAKEAILKEGDEIVLIADYYSYDGTFQENYQLGDPIYVDGDLEVNYVEIGDAAYGAYCLTDIYGEAYWTPVIAQ